MNYQSAFRILTLVCIIFLSACSSKTTPPTLSWTPPATTPTPRGDPTPTPTRRPAIPLGERQKVVAGGYSLQVPVNLEIKINNDQALISNQDDTIMVVLGITPRKNSTQTVKSALSGFLLNIKTIKGLKSGQPVPAQIAGIEGLAVDITGSMLKTAGTGRVTLVEIGPPGFFFAYAFVADGKDGSRWETDGGKTYDSILQSLQFDQR